MRTSTTTGTGRGIHRLCGLLRRSPRRATWKATLADVRRAEFHHFPSA